MNQTTAGLQNHAEKGVSKIIQPANYMIQLDGLRLVAVACVMLAHWILIPSLSSLNRFLGVAGVNLFFLLSGFLITGILLRQKNSGKQSRMNAIRRFYIRRTLRIFPLYYLVLSLGVIFAIPSAREYFSWFVSYTANFIIGWTKGNGGYFTHLWSLAVEEQFYIFFPFIIFFLPSRFHHRVIILLGAFAILCRTVIVYRFKDKLQIEWVCYTFTPCCFDCFALGALLAYYKIKNAVKLQYFLKKYRYLFIVSLLLSFLLFALYEWSHNSYYMILIRTFYSVFIFWVIGLASFGNVQGIVGRFLRCSPVVYLGKITYGLYVYHYFVPYFFQMLNISHPFERVLYPFITVLIAACSFHFFEKPIQKFKDKFF